MEKICGICKESKNVSEFNKKKDRYQNNCRPCQKEYYRKYYRSNDKERLRLQDSNKARKQETNALLNSLKDVPCNDCGIKYPPYVMDFDHLEDKAFTIARRKHYVNREDLLLEVSKCEVVCSNCHRERTHNRSIS